MTDLLNVISASDKRRNLLILLSKGPREWDEIRQILRVTATGMLPQVRILEDEHLVVREGKRYSLTPLGMVLTCRMEPLVQILDILDKNPGFWREHDLGVLPRELLADIGMLGDYQIVEIPIEDFFNVNPFLDKIAGAKTIRGIAHTVHPKYPDFFLTLAKNGAETSLILTPGVFRIVLDTCPEKLGEFLACGHGHIYVSERDLRFSLVVTDMNFSLSLFYANGAFDARHDVVSFDPTALAWGQSIFSWYLKRSQEIRSLD